MVKFLTYTCSSVLIAILMYLFLPKQPETKYICGVSDIIEKVNTEITPQHIVEEWLGKEFQIENGKRIFLQECRACHEVGSRRLVGPGFHNLPNKFENTDWIINYIQNSDSVLISGDERAINIKEEFANIHFHHKFQYLSEQELIDLIGYISLVKFDYFQVPLPPLHHKNHFLANGYRVFLEGTIFFHYFQAGNTE